MKWTGFTSDNTQSLNTPVIVLNSPFSEESRTVLQPVKKRKADEPPEGCSSEVVFIDVIPAVCGASRTNSDSNTYKKRKKREWLSLQMQRAMIGDEDGDRPIHIAVAQENVSLVRHLCSLMEKAGSTLDVMNYLRQTPLHVAVLVGNEEIVNILLMGKASVHLRDKSGNTPLHLAVKYFESNDQKGRKVLQALLAHPQMKSVIDATDYQGMTVMHEAVSRHNEIAIHDLCAAGANIDAVDGKSGRTSLAYAVLAGDLQMVDLLLSYGASANQPDYGGLSSLDMALQTGNKSLIRLLEKKIKVTSADVTSNSSWISHSQEHSRKKENKKRSPKLLDRTKRKSNRNS